jgi:ATP-binding cassette, subfamily B, bacterial PglK
LDNVTEVAVMDALESLSGNKTMVLIAHRLSTVRDCDIIYFLEHGSLVAHGRYEELLSKNERFRAMANLA